MDVTCDRCSTRYEFDEALVSSKGTTVKCTNCGAQFKVYRPKGATQLDGWTIRTTDGRELTYNAMRKLQTAISSGAVSPEDVLIPNDGGEPKRLGKIEELKIFFKARLEEPTTPRVPLPNSPKRSRSSPPPPARQAAKTTTRVQGSPSSRPTDRDGDPVPSQTGKTLPPPSLSGPGIPPDRPTVPRAASLPREPSAKEAPTVARAAVPPTDGYEAAPSQPAASSRDAIDPDVHSDVSVHDAFDDDSGIDIGFAQPSRPLKEEPRTAARHDQPNTRDEDTLSDLSDVPPPPSSRRRVPSGRPADDSVYPVEPSDRGESLAPLTPSPSAARPSILRRSTPYTDPRFSTLGPTRKRPGLARWVVGIIAVGVLAVGGFALFDRYAPARNQSPQASSEDSRVNGFLQEGDKRLADGDVDGAKGQFIKASGITDNDPRVSRGLAHIEVINADMLWLNGQLLDEASPHRKALEQQLSNATKRAREAANIALKQAPDDGLSIAIAIDVLRLEGKREEARKLVAKLDGSGPDSHRALAMLDLLEDEPTYNSVVDRLRTAARAERKLARAQAILVYALACSGRKDDANKELGELESRAPNHALIAPLRAFVSQADEAPAASASASAATSVAVGGMPPPSNGRAAFDEAEPFATAEPDAIEPFATAEPDVTEPFATAEPDLTELPPTDDPPTDDPPTDVPPTDVPPANDPPAADTGDAPPAPPPEPKTEQPHIDTTDLPEFNE